MSEQANPVTESFASVLVGSRTKRLCKSDFDDLVELVKAMDRQCAAMDFTRPLYDHFKKEMKREDPAGL